MPALIAGRLKLQAAIGRSPRDASLYYWLGRCYFELTDFDRAIQNWEHATSLESQRSEYHDWLGRAYGRKADKISAARMLTAMSFARHTRLEFEIAVQRDPQNLQPQRDLIGFMIGAPGDLRGGKDRALAQIRALAAINPNADLLALGDFYSEKKKYDQAGAQYQKVLASATAVDADLEAADYYLDRPPT